MDKEEVRQIVQEVLAVEREIARLFGACPADILSPKKGEMSMPKFSKRHYEAVAALFVTTRPKETAEFAQAAGQWLRDVGHFLDMFRADNPAFDSARFLGACGREK